MHTISKLACSLVLAIGVAGACRGAAAPEVPSDAVALEMRELAQPIAQYIYSGLTERERLVIDDRAGWEQLWRRITANQMPATPVPELDFESEMVIVAAMGTRSSGGYSISIDSVLAGDDQLHVVVREVSPGARCIVTAALTAPVTAVRVARRDLPVTFIERTDVRDCD